MDIEDIKIGETYLLPVTVTTIEKSRWIEVATCHDYEYRLAPSEVKTLSPANGIIKNTETAPKYDLCRKFREGDKVRVVERNGRYQPNIPVDELWSGLLTVSEDENFCNNLVKVRREDGREKLSHWWYLELVTPVEELEPYRVEEDSQYWHVFYEQNGGLMTVCKFLKSYHPTAKAAAEAERDRLNAEWRKEQE